MGVEGFCSSAYGSTQRLPGVCTSHSVLAAHSTCKVLNIRANNVSCCVTTPQLQTSDKVTDGPKSNNTGIDQSIP